MSQQPPSIEKISLSDLTTMIIKERGLHEGLYELAISYNIGVGGFGTPPTNEIHPGVMVSIVGFEFRHAPPEGGPLVVDAAVVNPKTRAKAAKKATPL